jgi:molecular chaperone DnaK
MSDGPPRYLGIDLGTTNSAAAVFDGDEVVLVRNRDGGVLTPSIVRIDRKGRRTVGPRARRFLERDPDNTQVGFKRLMGTDKAVAFPASGESHTATELSAEVLRSLRDDVREQLGFVPERAVISVPALFELPQTAATSEAARLAGFERVELIQEPVASALAAGWSADDDSGGAWLVYDIGGGTFDVSLLETRDGLLRVVGHDGDNFLGGRDIDRALVDHVLARLADSGIVVDRADPAHAAALRQLAAGCEEAKIDLSRREEVDLFFAELFEVDGEPVDVEMVLDRELLARLVAPIVERTLTVCKRLLSTHGLTPDQLDRVVLVGGPTVMPALRERVGAALGARFSEGHDPMTLVARGAALYAATAGLDAQPAESTEPEGRRLWLQYPAMSSDLFPHVAGRLLEGDGPAPHEVRFVRGDGGWVGEWVALGSDGGFVAMLELAARKPNRFELEGRDRRGEPVAVHPGSISIVQGLTLGDPPLSRSVGVALASDHVHVYIERGTPLPARRSFVHQTVTTVAEGHDDAVLVIPVVQGELEQAHLCRLVGRIEIGGQALPETLPAGSKVEVTLEVDRGGRLSARALVPRLDMVFEHVAHLVVPDARPEELEGQIALLRERLTQLRRRAVQQGDAKLQDQLFDVEWALQDAQEAATAARGGDDDAAQRARRALLDTDATLDRLEQAASWPELDARAMTELAAASRWVGQFGTEPERTLLTESAAGVERARKARQPVELQRQLRVVRDLRMACFYRHPDAWKWSFDNVASDVSRCTDVPRARELVARGREALAADDHDTLRSVVHELWKLMPHDAQTQQLSHQSGLR